MNGETLKQGMETIKKYGTVDYSMVLNHDNYHSLENRYLTNSRIGDFLKCKRFFYDRHIAGTKEQKDKDCFKVGAAVDAWLTRGKEAFMSEFVAVARRNVKNPPEGYTELTQAQFDEVVSICEVAERQPAYQDLASHKAQEIIHCDLPIGYHFIGLAAIPDWICFDDETVIITDLKTTDKRSVEERDGDEGQFKYHYKCVALGYYMQFAVMWAILERTRPEIKNFVFRHLVIDKDPDVNTPYVFYLDTERVELFKRALLSRIILEIAAEKDFAPKIVTWQDAPLVGSIDRD
jgi:hypothetical protein